MAGDSTACSAEEGLGVDPLSAFTSLSSLNSLTETLSFYLFLSNYAAEMAVEKQVLTSPPTTGCILPPILSVLFICIRALLPRQPPTKYTRWFIFFLPLSSFFFLISSLGSQARSQQHKQRWSPRVTVRLTFHGLKALNKAPQKRPGRWSVVAGAHRRLAPPPRVGAPHVYDMPSSKMGLVSGLWGWQRFIIYLFTPCHREEK